MKTVIIYESKHHGNTKKVCDRIASECGTVLVEAGNVDEDFNWEDYELVGFASGIAYSRFYDGVVRAAQMIPKGRRYFSFIHVRRTIRTSLPGSKRQYQKEGLSVSDHMAAEVITLMARSGLSEE